MYWGRSADCSTSMDSVKPANTGICVKFTSKNLSLGDRACYLARLGLVLATVGLKGSSPVVQDLIHPLQLFVKVLAAKNTSCPFNGEQLYLCDFQSFFWQSADYKRQSIDILWMKEFQIARNRVDFCMYCSGTSRCRVHRHRTCTWKSSILYVREAGEQ